MDAAPSPVSVPVVLPAHGQCPASVACDQWSADGPQVQPDQSCSISKAKAKLLPVSSHMVAPAVTVLVGKALSSLLVSSPAPVFPSPNRREPWKHQCCCQAWLHPSGGV